MSDTVRFIDLFCGIGGFRFGTERVLRSRGLNGACVFSSDIDPDARRSYCANFGDLPHGDITQVSDEAIPDHDLLLAGFPCQPFSIIGASKGFEDTRGTLFFEIARIIRAKRPRAFVLENVKQLVGHDKGRTLKKILASLDELGYYHSHRVLNALDFGLPQKRERLFIAGFRDNVSMSWPVSPIPMTPLSSILEQEVSAEFYASEYIRNKRSKHCAPGPDPTIWHENKAGHISAYPFSCALRAGASYNYLLVDGKRRLTPREMLRLQGFPDSFIVACNYSATRKQAGNAVPVPVVSAVVERALDALGVGSSPPSYLDVDSRQYTMVIEEKLQYGRTKTSVGRSRKAPVPARGVP